MPAYNRIIIFLSLLAVCWVSTAGQDAIEIIPLKHRTVQEMVEVVRPLVEPGGTVTGMSNQLIIRATPGQIALVRDLLEKIDRPARNLMITVRQGQKSDQSIDAMGAAIDIQSDHARIRAGGPVPRRGLILEGRDGDSAIRGGIVRRDSYSGNDSEQRVQVLEGRQAFIRVGQSVPLPRRQVHIVGNTARVTDSVQYHDVTSGFYVLPRLSGDRVTLEISPYRNTPGNRTGLVETQQLSTAVSGRLGEWLDLGGIIDSQQRSQRGYLYKNETSINDQRSIWVKVEETKQR